MAEDGYTRIENPVEIEALIEALIGPSGASLQLGEHGEPLPVLVTEQRPGEGLDLDVSAIREVAGELQRGKAFRVLGQAHGKMVRTPELAMEACEQRDGRLVCRCPYPFFLEVLQRRDTFRARLRLGMEVGAILRGPDGKSVQGDLKDLSLEGCRLELPLAATALLAEAALPLEIELCFPDGTRFTVRGRPRHRRADTERQAVAVGFRFEGNGPEHERRLWHFVREIEQEAARHAEGGEASRLPSMLFQGAAQPTPEVGRRNMKAYPTPMARRLSRIAGYLDAQLLELKDGAEVDSVQLSRHADRLLGLHEEDREGLLFATACLHDESWLVAHGLGVAAHLLDLVGEASVPRELRKALVACAMVHDLGKALLPDEAWQGDEVSAEGTSHIALLEARMTHCQWLSPAVFASVVRRINERLDGSGYPEGRQGESLGELERAAAVVDAVDTLRRPLGERPAWRLGAIYRYLLDRDQAFDARWVKRYIRRFGLYPIGSLARFADGRLGWVQGLDAQTRPTRVQLTEVAEPPGESLGEVLEGEVSQRLGEPREEVPVEPKVGASPADS
ncbi:PilZ domain-containing protein [Halomonas koreensis]|uniref:PilZ domain-containing protein n=1 Tax=Halomonas koreensis TaxID=245385 RepID=A0ABU1G311_9GAMM|nr:PilZ domain-containing protein [Halomonas koreensis]MDR5866918.1 PilZ domain-containing protein [Halomonas koreensis]